MINLNQNRFINSAFRDIDFDFFQMPCFENDLDHWDYLMQKYIVSEAEFNIPLSYPLRSELTKMARGADTNYLIERCHMIKSESWHLLRDSYRRFQKTDEYKKLCTCHDL